jgi:hypothetical protein
MKKVLSLLVAITSLTLVFVNCNDDSVKPPINPNEDGEWRSDDKILAGTSWKLSGVVDVSTGVMSFPSICSTICENRMCYSLNFNTDGNLNTYSSANEYWGTYIVELRDDGDKTDYRININDLIGTKRYGEECDDGDKLWEKSFQTVKSFVLQENELKLFYNDDQNYLLFLRYSEDKSLVGEWEMLKEESYNQSLVGTSWKLYSINGTGFISLVDNLCPDVDCYSLKFKKDGTLRITSSVNESWGTYTVVSNEDKVFYNIYIADIIGTKVDYLTHEDVSLDDGWRRRIFPTIKSFAFQDGSLKLFYNDDQNCLVFKPL